jgi:DNA-binding transcriptional regulator LsrR (DeoR family)
MDSAAERSWRQSPEHLRLLAKVARMYHERALSQAEIAELLNLSQSRISRLLKEASSRGIIRTVVVLPDGLHADLEDKLEEMYGLRDVVVVETGGTDDVIPALGAAAAEYLDATLRGGDRIGISSWSESLLRAVDVMRPKRLQVVDTVTQLVGGVGSPDVQMQATRLISRLADMTGARPQFLPSAGVLATPRIRDAIAEDSAVAEVVKSWQDLTLALVGIGALVPSSLLKRSGNALADADLRELQARGAVGDVCLRYFDHMGQHIASPFDERVMGITPDDLKSIPRRLAVAGGIRKLSAIRAAVIGGWVNMLITDVDVARALVAEAP